MAKQKLVLSLDGGGIRGIISARILQEIEKQVGKPVWQIFDMVAGTSTGGILALALTQPKPSSAEDMVKFYIEKGPSIFKKPLISWNLCRPKYHPRGLDDALREQFGTYELKDALKPVLIPTYDLRGVVGTQYNPAVGAQPVFFSSQKAKSNAAYNFWTWEVARATSAAPTYFPPFRIKSRASGADWMETVDGGMVANNPAMCALVEACSAFGVELDNVLVVSIGTGNLCLKVNLAHALKWGLVGWAPHLIDVLMDSASDTVNHQMEEVLQPSAMPPHTPHYYRLQPTLSASTSAMDNTSSDNMHSLVALAAGYLTYNQDSIHKLCDFLIAHTISSRV